MILPVYFLLLDAVRLLHLFVPINLAFSPHTKLRLLQRPIFLNIL